MVMCYHLSCLELWSNTILANDVNLNVIFYSQITSALLFPYLVKMRIVQYILGCYFDKNWIYVDKYFICSIVNLRKRDCSCTTFDTNGIHDKGLTVQFNLLLFFGIVHFSLLVCHHMYTSHAQSSHTLLGGKVIFMFFIILFITPKNSMQMND